MNRLVLSILCALTLSMAFCAVGLWRCSKPSVVCVDIARIRGQFIEQLARHAASPEMVTKASSRFNQKLKFVLSDYAKHSKVLIMDSSFVLSGAIDVTEEITNSLSKVMGEGR